MEEFGISPFRTPEALGRTRAVRLKAILRSARGSQLLGIDMKVLLFVGAHTIALLILYVGKTALTDEVQAAWRWHTAASVIYVSALTLLIAATTGLYSTLYASDPGWVTQDAVDDGHSHTAYCHYCGFRPPLRSRHCLQTGQCVKKFDHFCYLLSTAIGDSNHARFYSFLVCELSLTVWGACIISDWAANCISRRGDSSDAADVCWRSLAPAVLLTTGVALLTLALFFGYLVALHTYLMLTGQTTYEVVKGSKVPYLAVYYRPLGCEGQRHVHLPQEFPRLLLRHVFPTSSGHAPPPPAPFSLGWRRNLAVFWLNPKPYIYRVRLPPPPETAGGNDGDGGCNIHGSSSGSAVPVLPSAVIDVQYSQGEV